MKAKSLFIIGIVLLLLTISILPLGTDYCTISSQCNLIYAFALTTTIFGGIIVTAVSILLAIYQRLHPHPINLQEPQRPFWVRLSRKKPSRLRVFLATSLSVMLGVLAIIAVQQIGHRPAWDFNGSFAIYYGSAQFVDGNTYSFNLTMSVVLHNSSFAYINVFTKISSPNGNLVNKSTLWFRTENESSNPFVSGSPLSKYTTTIVLQSKRLTATAFTYAKDQLNFVNASLISAFTSYETNCVPFPVIYSIDFNSLGSGRLNVTLLNTDIPGLLPSNPLLGNIGIPSCP